MPPPARYYLGLRNLAKNLTAETIQSNLFLYPSISGLKILPGRTDKDKTAEVSSENKNEIIAAAKTLQKGEDWSWNNGLRARVDVCESGSHPGLVGPKHVIDEKTFTPRPEFIGENINDVAENFRPGVVVRLPAYNQKAMGVEMDRRLRNQSALFGHPAIIVHNHSIDNLVNIVLCTDLNGRSVLNVLSGSRREMTRRALGNRIMEVATDNTINGSENVYPHTPVLEFEGGEVLHTKEKIYAEITVYTVDLRALAKLEMSVISGHRTEALGYIRLAEFWHLTSQIKKNKIQYKEMNPTELRGVDLTKLTYKERIQVIKRMKQDAAEGRAKKYKAEHTRLHMLEMAAKKGWKLPGDHPEAIMRRALRKSIRPDLEAVRTVNLGTTSISPALENEGLGAVEEALERQSIVFRKLDLSSSPPLIQHQTSRSQREEVGQRQKTGT